MTITSPDKTAQALTVTEPTVAQAIDALVVKAQVALKAYDTFTQDAINLIVKKASVAALNQHGVLAQLAVTETGRGVFEDKAVKNIFACEHVTHSMAPMKTVGIISDDPLTGITEIAEPVGVVAGITPVTNPTSTAIFKSLIALKPATPSSLASTQAPRNRPLRPRALCATLPSRPAPQTTASSGWSSLRSRPQTSL